MNSVTDDDKKDRSEEREIRGRMGIDGSHLSKTFEEQALEDNKYMREAEVDNFRRSSTNTVM